MARREDEPVTYVSTGVDYNAMDPFKRLAQLRARATARNLERFGMREVEASRGESAYVWEEPDSYRAFVIEGLGTKNRVADETRKITGKTYYDAIAQDTIAMIVNDLIVVGAEPQVVNAYFAVGSSDWFLDEERARDLVEGWAKACSLAGAVWGGGETPTLKGIIEPDTIDLSGSSIGIIKPKERLTLGDKLTPGDAILLVENSGIHANGLTLVRRIASKLPEGYATPLSDGKSYGESLLVPTHIYAGLIRDLFEAGIDMHYMVNITGHGWRKLMRATRDLSYVIDQIPEPQSVFRFIQERSGNDDTEMYGNFNMGTGFAIFIPEKAVELAQRVAAGSHGFSTLRAGYVEKGQKKVVIRPKNVIFKGETLGFR
ncbi:MAG: phosphoribosylformylglycinamidine cyclo-ligase [Candidatus Blackburnbacteria bacterium RIFCSPLOWO2_01_FULL_41_27]|uniref:Phosphoribosylformylglycinamidine cyclo-ligase n=2 Tax=Candidatus Blackburniibacteriota TaxID=1817898 RepID=A0A1G1VAB3_9BACT|nr:MAG: phosphoribosylformylglycinamidine cyclo-ligase [Candidatus Levybacteria bacterium RIFCSPLOWO2_02_FULL_36_8b]OGY12390.1 MAG: phosphoribosylformylglycinamidine cyclo-ligase [Candidatus Blackburnbacteria bacterium RIFCSPHIGHO2_12_FULL_41_13b]OGY14401.1 MAG: phosphoribosylformylglycinamidine cyclo-ligase [Candidatus Blackburnbacteria bacterium RIFCSPLOWO2_01_FULL_41_27]